MSRRDSFGRQVLRGVLRGPASLIPEPINWPARFRAAGAVAQASGRGGTAIELRDLANTLADPDMPSDLVEAIGRALLGEES